MTLMNKSKRHFSFRMARRSALLSAGFAVALCLTGLRGNPLVSSAQAQPPAGQDFTVVVLPDTQFYSKDYPELFQSQVNWIISNRVSLNIVYVASVGDIVDGANDAAQWSNATQALYRLEDPALSGLPQGIPYGVVPGNHDHAGDGSSKSYDQFFGVSHFEKKPYYGGHFGANNNNHFDLFSAGGMDFVVVYLDYWVIKNQKVDFSAQDTWADGVLKANAKRRAIVVSHTIVTPANEFNKRGQEIYDRLKGNANVFLMVCGHLGGGGGEGRRQDMFEGHTIHSCLSDYQSMKPKGGNGFLRLYQFSPKNNCINAKSYSPALDQWRTNANGQFVLDYPMSAGR